VINFVLFLLVLIVSPVLAAGEAQWTPALNEDGIQIYTRPVTDSPFAAVKGVLTIGAPLERVVAKLGNDDECAEWRKTCKSTRVLQLGAIPQPAQLNTQTAAHRHCTALLGLEFTNAQ